MPVNFQEVQRQIKSKSTTLPEHNRILSERCQKAQALLETYSLKLAALKDKVERAAAINPRLRLAVPFEGPLAAPYPLPALTMPRVLLAADGSQVVPNRHDPVQFGVINVGVFRMQPGQGEAPNQITNTELLYAEEFSDAPLTEEIIYLMRDLNERQLLAELASQESCVAEKGAVITLTDGPLELVREPIAGTSPRRQVSELLEKYLAALDDLAALGVTTAGYVDRPRSDLVVRLLELADLPDDQLAQAGVERPLRPVTDLLLFESLLSPGDRSAIFAIQSEGARSFTGAKALHFFYLNVGLPGAPYLARVEIPAWVAEEQCLVDGLHAFLIYQCRQMGPRPYPYALNRAHEIALVSMDEKQQVMVMIMNELRRIGVPVGGASYKQTAKDGLAAHGRY